MTASSDPFSAIRDGGVAPVIGPGVRAFAAVAEVDGFLLLRRRLGYSVAEAVMLTVAARLGAATPGATLGRIGRASAEFTFRASDRESAVRALSHAALACAEAIDADGIRLFLRVAIGVVDLGDRPMDDASIDLAAAAAIDARREHKPFRIVDVTDPYAAPIDEFLPLRRLPEAMSSGALQVHYQPKLRARSNTVDSAEALLRWHDPATGTVSIEQLVRVAEETGVIRELTEWVIARAVADRATLAASGFPLTLYVNISGRLLPDSEFAARALDMVAGAGGGIGFEITETAVIGDPDRAIQHLHAFSAAGIRIAIDDYGSGLSSLAYLKQLPAHELKIDRLFIKELTESHRDPLLVRSSIDLAHALEMEVTAEGVDNPLALALLRIMGCDLMQGYLISPAISLDELCRFLADTVRLEALTNPVLPGMWANAQSKLIAI